MMRDRNYTAEDLHRLPNRNLKDVRDWMLRSELIIGKVLTLTLTLRGSKRTLFGCLLGLVYFAVINKTLTKTYLGRKDFPLAHMIKSIIEGSQCRNLEVGTEAEVMKEQCLLDAFHGLLSLFSWVTKDHLPVGGSVHSGLSPPTLTINQENVPQTCPQDTIL